METTDMNKEKVIQLLKFFPEIEDKIKIQKSIISNFSQYYNPITGIQYDGMAKGKNHISKPTEKMALNVPDYVHETIRECENEIKTLHKVKIEILKEVSRLKLKHKNVIFSFYFQHLTWRDVAAYTKYSDRQCKNIRDEALELLIQGFAKNSVLVAYQIKEYDF